MKTRLVILSALCALFLQSCGRERSQSAVVDATNSISGNATRGSIYDLDMTFQDQDGRATQWQSLKGKVQVMAMIFTHCQATCPMITSEIKHAESLIPESDRANVNFTLISFDSKRDTSAALKAKFDEMQLNGHWKLLHGSAEDVQTVAGLLDVKFKELPSGDFSHSNVILVIDKDGHIIMRREGIERNPAQIADAVKSQF